jgi:hypothetical protein
MVMVVTDTNHQRENGILFMFMRQSQGKAQSDSNLS